MSLTHRLTDDQAALLLRKLSHRARGHVHLRKPPRQRAYGLGLRNPDTLPGAVGYESIELNDAQSSCWRALGKAVRSPAAVGWRYGA